MQARKRLLALLVAAFLTAGCTVGPNYSRPKADVPAAFRAPDPLPPGQAASIADLKWFEVFKDEKLQGLVRTAPERNYDLRDAVARPALKSTHFRARRRLGDTLRMAA